MPLFSREKSSLKGRWRLETVQDMRSSSSNPVSCSENSIKIYGSKEEIRVRKSPETVDAPGFAPDASIPVTLYGAEGETRRVFNPSCSLCEQFILCPFLLRKKMDEEFESLQTNSYIQKEKAQRKNPCAFSGAEGETRTLAPVTRPTPLAGAPRHQLEYFCIGSVYDTIRLLKERAENPLSLLSGGESGIRTHGTLPYDGFQDRSVITTSVSLRIRRKL